MPKHDVKFINKAEVAEGTFSYRFEKPLDVDYQPGQHMVIHLDVEKSDKETGLRNMSLASSPTEEYLEIVIRQSSSAFKQKLAELQAGDQVRMFGPVGIFVLPEENIQPIVMIAGGIGVTPFRSMIKYIQDKGLSYNINLFYSNPTIERVTFKDELDSMQDDSVNIIYTLTEQVSDNWQGEQGRVNSEMLRKYISGLEEPVYYICGPTDMVHDIEKELLSLGVNKEQTKIEEFTGY